MMSPKDETLLSEARPSTPPQKLGRQTTSIGQILVNAAFGTIAVLLLA
jgi:hypothetical protein